MEESKQTSYKIAAVVVTYNRLELLKECVSALKKQTRKLDEIIVVNNSSTDGTLEWLNGQNELTVINQTNSGSSGGQHTGIKTAHEKGNDWIWCMDDDSEPVINTLSEMCRFLNKGEFVLSPQIVDEHNQILYEHRGYFNFSRLIKGDLQLPAKMEDYNREYFRVDFASFVGILINRVVIDKVGLPHKEFFIYHDDIEYCLRIRNISKIGVVPSSIIVHKVSLKTNHQLKSKFFWVSERPLLCHYGIKCICYRNIFYLYMNYFPHKLLGVLTVLFNYFVLTRRIILFDDYKIYRLKYLSKAMFDAVIERFDNNYYLKLPKYDDK